jgi:hypothetical protein
MLNRYTVGCVLACVLAFLVIAALLMSGTLLEIEANTATNVERSQQVLEALETQGNKLNAIWGVVENPPVVEEITTYSYEDGDVKAFYYGAFASCIGLGNPPANCKAYVDATYLEVENDYGGDHLDRIELFDFPPEPAPGTIPNLAPRGSS